MLVVAWRTLKRGVSFSRDCSCVHVLVKWAHILCTPDDLHIYYPVVFIKMNSLTLVFVAHLNIIVRRKSTSSIAKCPSYY